MNITKVIPVLAPILNSLSGAFAAPNATVASVFGTIDRFVNTTAFKPLLQLLATSTNGTASVGALVSLSPMLMATGSARNATIAELQGLSSLFNVSTNPNMTITGMESMMANVNMSDSDLLDASSMVLTMLSESSDPKETVEGLLVMNNLTFQQKASLLPVFQLFRNSKEINTTLDSLQAFMNVTIPASTATSLFTALEKENSTDDLLKEINSFAALAPANLKPTLTALSNLIENSENATLSLTTLEKMLKNNLTSADYAKKSLSALTDILDDAKNQTEALNDVQTLATSTTNATTTTNQLLALDTILSASNNTQQSVKAFNSIMTALVANPSSVNYIPYLFTILENSSNPSKTINNLAIFSVWAMSNLTQLMPAMPLLQDVVKYKPLNESQLFDLYPKMFGYFGVPSAFQLSVFTICEYNSDDKITKCSKSHAVQNMDFVSIIWAALQESKFAPYLTALEVTNKDQLHLQGDLLNKEHQYVPAVKAFLALSIIGIITAFFLLFITTYIWIKHAPLHNKFWFFVMCYVIFNAMFTGVACVIPTCMIDIIKSGTKKDNYGVVFTYSDAFMGLTWTSFCVVIFICPIYFSLQLADVTTNIQNKNTYPVAAVAAGTISDNDSTTTVEDEDIADKERTNLNINAADSTTTSSESKASNGLDSPV